MSNQRGFSLPLIVAIIFLAILAIIIFISLKPQTPKVASTSQSNKNTTLKPSPSSAQAKEKGDVEQNEQSLNSPDGTQFATYYYKGPLQYEGGLTLNKVDIHDKETENVKTLDLTGPITYARGSMFWSESTERIYFTHSTNGVGTFELWSSKVDGKDAKIVSSGEKSPIHGAQSIDMSSDGELIITLKPDDKSGKPFWVMNVDGSNAHAISVPGKFSNLKNIEFEEDDYYITFESSDGKEDILYETNLDGVNPEEVEP